MPADQKGDVARASYATVLGRITASGTPVLVVRDTPVAKVDVPTCLETAEGDTSACGMDLADGIERDPLAEAGAADASGLVSVLDVNDLVCPDGYCAPVLGGVVTFFDHGHLSATFAATLEPEVTAAMEQRIAG